jgi:L-2-hydroxyglutarate oxidase LhgO
MDNLVIGGGVVGLAIASRLRGKTALIERHYTFGMETSSRNSQVVHAGIYYPKESLKTKFCIQGRRMLKDLCSRANIPYSEIGKVVVASKGQEKELLDIFNHATALGVPMTRLTKHQMGRLEPLVSCQEALLSPKTAIIDSHELMKHLEHQILNAGNYISYKSELLSLKRLNNGYLAEIKTGSERFTIQSTNVINTAGLDAVKIANMIPGSTSYQKTNYSKGHYFYLTKKLPIRHLVYPIPDKNLESLGIHLTLDLAGKIKFGPDVCYSNNFNYAFESTAGKFCKAIQSYLPCVSESDLVPDYVGIRPKLSTSFSDFQITNQEGLVNLLGIESPGLTSCLAIAEHVREML